MPRQVPCPNCRRSRQSRFQECTPVRIQDATEGAITDITTVVRNRVHQQVSHPGEEDSRCLPAGSWPSVYHFCCCDHTPKVDWYRRSPASVQLSGVECRDSCAHLYKRHDANRSRLQDGVAARRRKEPWRGQRCCWSSRLQLQHRRQVDRGRHYGSSSRRNYECSYYSQERCPYIERRDEVAARERQCPDYATQGTIAGSDWTATAEDGPYGEREKRHRGWLAGDAATTSA